MSTSEMLDVYIINIQKMKVKYILEENKLFKL